MEENVPFFIFKNLICWKKRPNFFFQAEDGIRDRSPSRGLGDVYKRQTYIIMTKKGENFKAKAFMVVNLF